MDALAARMDVWSDRINPILVRETRQRIKGKFFPATFLLLVGVSWLICVGTVLATQSTFEMSEIGPRLLSTLLLVMGIPLCYAAPLNLFRSITQEFDGQTFEVLAVTTLSPGRIVIGKLQSCITEVGAYTCAVAPFICFSYLLRGVSIAGLLSGLVVMLCASAVCSVGAMLLGAISKQSYLQAISIIVLMIGCTITFSSATNMAYISLSYSIYDADLIPQGLICFAVAAVFGGVFSMAVAVSQFTPTRYQQGYSPLPDGVSFFSQSREGDASGSKRRAASDNSAVEGERPRALANPFGSRLDEERRLQPPKDDAASNP